MSSSEALQVIFSNDDILKKNNAAQLIQEFSTVC